MFSRLKHRIRSLSGTRGGLKRGRKISLAAMSVLGLVAIVFWSPIQRELTLRLVLRSASPDEGVVAELAGGATDPAAVLERLWRAGTIPHRALAINYLKNKAPGDRELLRRADALLLEATVDVDFTVRESAFGVLTALDHPRLSQAARDQLPDYDPQARVLGLRHLRRQKDSVPLPAIVRLLDDHDPFVVTSASAVLQAWTGQDFGIRQQMAIRRPAADDGPASDAESERKIAEGVHRWKEWWAAHQGEYAAEPQPAPYRPARLSAQDFELPDLSDKIVRLSEFRGKVVLLNFWTTWCASCRLEIPHLMELQRRNPERLVVLGVSLDGLPDDHGHGHNHTEPGSLRQIVARFVARTGINYRVLLDPKAAVGRRFNGNELPTNVFIDPEGFVRRRFIGGRSVRTFEAMLRELDGENRKGN